MCKIMRYELRLQDFSLADYQLELRDSFALFFKKECPISAVRDVEPLGYAPELWKRLVRATQLAGLSSLQALTIA